jgi:hypothetical protein
LCECWSQATCPQGLDAQQQTHHGQERLSTSSSNFSVVPGLVQVCMHVISRQHTRTKQPRKLVLFPSCRGGGCVPGSSKISIPFDLFLIYRNRCTWPWQKDWIIKIKISQSAVATPPVLSLLWF